MKAAEFYLEKMAAAWVESEKLQLVRAIQCDVLNSIGQFAMEEREFVFAARIGTVAGAIEALGDKPTPTSPVVPVQPT